jgi:hypothetical protein
VPVTAAVLRQVEHRRAKEAERQAALKAEAEALRTALNTIGRFTVKKYRSVRRVTEDDWSHEHIELLPLNRDYDPIIVTPHEAPEMVVVGEWVASID